MRSCEVCGNSGPSVREKEFEHEPCTTFRLWLCGWCMVLLCSKEVA